MNKISWMFFISFSVQCHAFSEIRKAKVSKDQVVTVRTSLGIATIIETTEQMNSVILGDRSAFKVEYLDRALTITPLYDGAKSNLYIFTDSRRFNVRLVPTGHKTADYVVELENLIEPQMYYRPAWINFRSQLNNAGVKLITKRVAKTRGGVLLVEFEIRSDHRIEFQPDWIWMTQNGHVHPIHNLSISSQKIDAGGKIKGIMQILETDLSLTTPVQIEIRRKTRSYLTLPKVVGWK